MSKRKSEASDEESDTTIKKLPNGAIEITMRIHPNRKSIVSAFSYLEEYLDNYDDGVDDDNEFAKDEDDIEEYAVRFTQTFLIKDLVALSGKEIDLKNKLVRLTRGKPLEKFLGNAFLEKLEMNHEDMIKDLEFKLQPTRKKLEISNFYLDDRNIVELTYFHLIEGCPEID